MPETATEPKTRPLFTARGGANGIEVKLTKTAEDALSRAAAVLDGLSNANGLFPKAAALGEAMSGFVDDPTAKPETKP